ncbi:hypothetical protein GCM10007874_00660 [Labrys miyagiensis]|uniref:Uncharacterized protein n=2 Tax=Labrys miyagiensis TaxID=346912 RepID=A0ABQ6C9K5_9HYPH|nr:hypothetical protein GCM10007874_00660 [Labrys miyagiensis]
MVCNGAMKRFGWLGRINAYFGNDEPHLAAAGSVALIIAGNQPFYPLYVAAIAGGKFWPALLTWFSTPFFLAVPAVCRRAPLSGRLLLAACAIGNTMVTAAALGPRSWVELFYLPCLALAPLLFAGKEAGYGLIACVIGSGVGLLVIHGSHQHGLAAFDDEQFRALARLHGFSVAGLLIVFAFLALRLRRQLRATTVSHSGH